MTGFEKLIVSGNSNTKGRRLPSNRGGFGNRLPSHAINISRFGIGFAKESTEPPLFIRAESEATDVTPRG
jgi:hypothetical protein